MGSPEPSAEAGSAASVVGEAGTAPAAVAVRSPVPAEVLGDFVGLADRVRPASGVPASVAAPADSVEPAPEPGEEVRGADVVGPDALVARGVSVVGSGAVVAGAGAAVGDGAGGAVRGCWPDPNRKPMTLPAGGS